MKSFILILLLIPFTTYGYNISDKNKNILEEFKTKAISIYDKNPSKSYIVLKRINNIKDDYQNNKLAIYTLNYILDFTNKYIYEYESSLNQKDDEIKDETLNQQEENKNTYTIDDEINSQNNKLETLDISNYKTISSFDIEANIDHIILQNIYLENTGSINDINVLDDIYLVNKDNKILSSGYTLNNYIYFDIPNYTIKRNDLENFKVVSTLKLSININQTGELILNLSTPSNAKIGTSEGIKAISYSNGSDIISNVSIYNPIKTIITKSNYYVNTNDFIPSYNKALEFSISNNSNDKLKLDSFKFRVNGSFLNYIGDSTEFILKRKNSNQIFGTATKLDIVDNYLTITHNGNDYDFMSSGTFNEYELEIRHNGNPEGTREIKLQNIIIGDGFGGTIDNLDEFSNSGLPGEWSVYRY